MLLLSREGRAGIIASVMMIVAAKNRVQFREEASRENLGREYFLYIKFLLIFILVQV